MKTIVFAFVFLIIESSMYSQPWENTSNFDYGDRIKNVEFINATTGWLTIERYNGNPTMLMKRTTNKGISWSDVNTFNGIMTDESDVSVDFVDQNIGYRFYRPTGSTNAVVERTYDGGNSWSNPIFQTSAFPIKPTIKFINSTTGFLIFNHRVTGGEIVAEIYKTINSGSNWQQKLILSHANVMYQLRDLALVNQNGTIVVCAVGYWKSMYYPQYSFGIRSISYDDGENFDTPLIPVEPEHNVYSYVQLINGADVSTLVVGVKKEAGVPDGTYFTKYVNGTPVDYFIDGNIYDEDIGGIVFSSLNRGYVIINDKVYKTENGGVNWSIDLSIPDQVHYGFNVIKGSGDVAYFGTWHGKFYTRKIFGNFNSNFDWQGGTGSIAVDGENIGTPSSGYFRGGSTALYANQFMVNGTDTTSRFYYWGGNCNLSMNWNNSYSTLEYSGLQINADYKTKLLSTEQTALANANQVKSIKDTNGVTNLIYESMGGIFYTRTRPDGNFKAEEVLSSSGYYPHLGSATFNNKNPYLSEVKNSNETEKNMWACWERKEDSNIKIIGSARIYDNNNAPDLPKHYWGTTELLTLNSVPGGFQCYPKIFVAGAGANPLRVLTYLKPDGGNKKIVARVYTNTNIVQEFDLTTVGNIQEYAISPIYPYYGITFQLHVTYRKDQTVYYKSVKIGQLSTWNGTYADYGVIDQDIVISGNDGNMWRASLDMSLKNTSTTAGVFNMQPVVTYQGRKSIRIVKDNFDGSTSIIETDAYPIVVKERLSNGNWSTGNIIYNSYSSLQQTPNIVGSKLTNACILNFTRIEGGVTKTLQVVPRWNSNQINTHFCTPNTFIGIDSRLRKGSIINSSSTIDSMMTLSQQGSLYKIDRQRFTITDNPSLEDAGFEFVNGVVVNDNVKYSFNLGNIIVNSKEVAFSNELDTAVESSGELNQSMHSLPFALSNDDTLIIGRNASYIPETPEANFTEIEYWVNLVNKTSGRVHKLLAHDTMQVNDTIQLEYLEGFIISDIPEGTDSFYVNLEIDTINAGDFGIGGGEGSGGMSGSGENLGFKRKIFWEKENHTSANNSLPTVFNLYQNFPNPFNPVTLIKYDLPKDVNVTLKIYDLLGREVETLVNNEIRSAGRYELNWNASKYASGVYIYRLQAGDYIETKKMVLIK